MKTAVVRRILAVTGLAVLWAAAAGAQPAPAGSGNVEADAIRCWWRTSTGAVRVGEQFSVVLTCAVIENATTTVVPDQSQLEPGVILLPPFDVLSGTHPADLRTVNRRFFQYHYVVRLIQETMFGKDVALPELRINFRLRTRVEDESMIEGRDQAYLLPPASIRVLSLVPTGALDIRDATGETFADIESRTLRSTVLLTTGGVLFGLSAIMGLLALVGVGKHFFHQEGKTRQLVEDATVLRGAARELEDVRRQREATEWSDGLSGRALTALRVVGAYALGRRTSQATAEAGVNGLEGHLVLPSGWLRRTRANVSASVTPDTIAQAIPYSREGSRKREDLERLQTALTRFSASRYGSSNGDQATALDDSVGDGIAIARRLAVQNFWLFKKFRALKWPAGWPGSQA